MNTFLLAYDTCPDTITALALAVFLIAVASVLVIVRECRR